MQPSTCSALVIWVALAALALEGSIGEQNAWAEYPPMEFLAVITQQFHAHRT